MLLVMQDRLCPLSPATTLIPSQTGASALPGLQAVVRPVVNAFSTPDRRAAQARTQVERFPAP